MKFLSALRTGEKARIKNLSKIKDVPFSLRLQEMGLTVNSIVEIAHVAPLGGTLALRIRSTVIAIRSEDADCIEIEIEGVKP